MSRRLFVLLLASAVLAAGCAMPKMPKMPKFKIPRVHKITVQQGNVITQEMVDQLKPGMTREQVAFIMGEPVVRNIFNQDRWDYIYTIRVPGRFETEQRFTVFFQNDTLSSLAGDLAPSDATGEGGRRGLAPLGQRPAAAGFLGIKQQGPIQLDAVAGAQLPVAINLPAVNAHGHAIQVQAIEGGMASRLPHSHPHGGAFIHIKGKHHLPLGGGVSYFDPQAAPNWSWARWQKASITALAIAPTLLATARDSRRRAPLKAKFKSELHPAATAAAEFGKPPFALEVAERAIHQVKPDRAARLQHVAGCEALLETLGRDGQPRLHGCWVQPPKRPR